jgi:hypothetical protein
MVKQSFDRLSAFTTAALEVDPEGRSVIVEVINGTFES